MRTIQSTRFVPFNQPGDLRARIRELILDGWFLTAIARPAGIWRGQWCCVFLERRGSGNRPAVDPTPMQEPLPWSIEALQSYEEAEMRNMAEEDAWLHRLAI